MKKIAILLGLAAVLTTGLMADKCTVNPPQAPATTEPEKDKAAPDKAPDAGQTEPTPNTPPAQ